MHWHSLSFERISQSFELFAVWDRAPSPAKNPINASDQAHRTQAQQGRLKSSCKTCSPCLTLHNTPRKSTLQNGAEGVFSTEAGGWPPPLRKSGLKAVLKRFASLTSPIWAFSAFPRARHLPSSLSNPAAMHLLRSSREKSPHHTPIQNDGLFWPANRKSRAHLCAQPSISSLGTSARLHSPRTICRSRVHPSDHPFDAARHAYVCFSSGQVVDLDTSPPSIPLPRRSRWGFRCRRLNGFAP
jgi:hypothetical protein